MQNSFPPRLQLDLTIQNSFEISTMPDVYANIEYDMLSSAIKLFGLIDQRYLQDLKLYKTEKPYWCLLPPHEGFNPDTQRVDNLEFETRENILVKDFRQRKNHVNLDEHGFQVLAHTTRVPGFDCAEDIHAYIQETERLLEETFEACFVKTYHHVLRKNIPFQRTEFDINDPLHTEGVAQGAHNGRSIGFKAVYTLTNVRYYAKVGPRSNQASFAD